MSSNLIRLGVVGATGKSGALVVSLLSEFPQYQLSSAVTSPQSKLLGDVCCTREANQGSEVRYSSDLAAAVASSQVIIDFSTRSSSLEVARLCASAGVPCLIATTGHDESELREIKHAALKTAIVFLPNTSIGIFVMHELAALASQLLGKDFDIEIFELHHNQKKDAPSGTALSLAKRLADRGDLRLVERHSAHQTRSQGEIGVSSARAGDVPGEHTIFFIGQGERIEITHRARDRSTFARGALRLLPRLLKLRPGLYGLKDIIA